MLFESYCKKSVSNAAKKERQKKAARGLMEQSLSELTDAALYGVVAKSGEVEQEIILLDYFKGLKDAKIAPLVSRSISTVSRRRRAATKRLRELIENTS